MKFSDISWCFLVLVIVCFIEIHGKSSRSVRRNLERIHEERRQVDQFRANHDFVANFATRNGSSDPEVNKRVSQMARYIVHKSTYAPVATISREVGIVGHPFNHIKSMVDGPTGGSTGIPYFYLSPKDFTAKDLAEDPRATITMTLDEDGYCRDRELDPEDTSCPRVIVVGTIEPLSEDAADYKFAHDTLFKRHPSMKTWPKDYDYFVAKMNITDVVLFYKTRLPQCAPVPLYFSVQPKFISVDKL